MKARDLAYAVLSYFVVRSWGAPVTSLETAALTWPVVVMVGARPLAGRGGSRITQQYDPPGHMGVDIAIPGALTTATAIVRALADGVVHAAERGARGWYVLLSHRDWASAYLHMSAVTDGIQQGATVKAGQELGPMGADPTDPERIVHLHLQIAPGGRVTDPEPYLQRAS